MFNSAILCTVYHDLNTFLMFKNRYVGVLYVIWNVGKADVILLYIQRNTICKIIILGSFFHLNSAQLMAFEPSSGV